MTNGESVKDMMSKFDKLEKFKGQDFRRWQKKMHFLLTTLKVVYVLSTPSPVWSENETLEATRKRMKWENDDYICRGHILNGMSDSLFDIYQNAESAKSLWESLESKYMAEDASAKKFLVSNFMNYKMVDTRPVMEQYHEMLRILGQYTQHNLMMDEAISVAVIIDKLPPSWKEFKHGLRNHELDNIPKGKNQIGSSSVNMVEGDGAKNSNNNKNKRKFKSGDDKFSNKKATVTCWKCNKPGHMKKDCRSRKGNHGAGSNGSKDPEKQQGYNYDFMQNFYNVLHYVSIISDAFYVQDDEVAWWVDSGATSHVCKDLRWSQVCKSIEDGSFVKMGNVATEPIKGIGRVLLTFTFGKTLYLDNVLYVPGIRKNLVSEIVLNKCGYKQVLESDKYILSRHGSFVGFGYVCNGMIRLNLNYPLFNASACMITSSHSNSLSKYELWHARLEHVHYKSIKLVLDISVILLAVVRLTEPKMKNLGEKGIDCIFIGYAEHSKCYRFYVIEPNDYVSVNSIIESRDAIFDEERFTSIPRPRGMIQPSSSKIAEDEVEGTDDVPGPSVPRKSTRTRKAKDVAFWKEAVQSEIDSIMHNDTWELTDLPPGCKALGCKWILKRKMKVDGSIDKYKARLVIQGFRQKEGIDFFDTYAPVARITTIRLLLALAAIHEVIHQVDVETAFLNDDLDEEIYMKQPEGFVMPGHEKKLCKLKKSLYGTLVSQLEYSRAIGCLMYAMISTRPDISFAVEKHNRYTSNLSALYWQALEGYSDASWINNMEDHSSTSGWVFLLGGGVISWALKKQTCITSSTMDFEFVALAAAGNEAEWLRNSVYEIPLWPKPMSTISIRCDSAATLAKAYSQVYNGKSRHLGVRHSMIRELIMNGVISVEFLRTQLNLADHLTKGLAKDLVRRAAIKSLYQDTQFPSNVMLDAEFNEEILISLDWNT
ncbi:zinc finger, CCHC-type containing protein [Tanacetum coccineum]